MAHLSHARTYRTRFSVSHRRCIPELKLSYTTLGNPNGEPVLSSFCMKAGAPAASSYERSAETNRDTLSAASSQLC